MSNIIAKILLFLFLPLSPFIFYGFGKEFWQIVSKFSYRSSITVAFFIGIVLFFPFHFLGKRLFRSTWNYLTTLEHECTHALVGLLFGKIPVSMRVSAWEGGEVKLRGGGNLWIFLAPYFLPTLSLIVLLGGWVFNLWENLWFFGVLGWTIAFHLVTNWEETGFRQTDLQRAGFLTSILVLPVANLLTYGTVLSFVFGGLSGFSTFWLNGFKNSWSTVQSLFL